MILVHLLALYFDSGLKVLCQRMIATRYTLACQRIQTPIFSSNVDNFDVKLIQIPFCIYGGAMRLVQCPKLAKMFEIVRSCVLSAIHFYTSLFHFVVPGSEFRIYN